MHCEDQRHLGLCISSCTRAKPWQVDSDYIKGNQMKLFQQNVAYFVDACIKNNDLQ